VIDPASETEFVLRRPAVWAIGQGPWEPAHRSPEVFAGCRIDRRRARRARPVVATATRQGVCAAGTDRRLHLVDGLDQAELDAILQRLAARWAADDRIAVLVDSLTVKLVRG
jgi:hypothetical protein